MLGIVASFAIWSTTAAVPDGEQGLELEIAATHILAREAGDALWPGYGAAPFGILLVLPDREVLLCRSPPPGFAEAGRNEATGCDRFTRAPQRLARCPAGGDADLRAALDDRRSARRPRPGAALPRWRSTLLHEHFHQWQSALPEHYARVAALDLAGGDESGMWMLDFAFPYADGRVAAAHAAASRTLAAAAGGARDPRVPPAPRRLPDPPPRLRAAAGERNWRYFEFQLWQEGVARWTEIAISPHILGCRCAGRRRMLIRPPC